MYARLYSAQADLHEAKLITVEISKSNKGASSATIVGLPDKAVEEAKDRVSAAIENSSFEKRSDFKSLNSNFSQITISLAPAGLKKTGSVFDLPIAILYLYVLEELDNLPDKVLFAGELALDGSLRPINGVLSIAEFAEKAGFDAIVVPKANAKEAAVSNIPVYAFSSLDEIVFHMRRKKIKQPEKKTQIKIESKYNITIDEIKGQELAKRALSIAAAGRHNIAFYGPPGTGKSLLSKALLSLLPPISKNDAIELTKIYSFAGINNGDIINKTPFRAPHHSSSYVSIVGGGAKLMPGEISFAHKGILFMDEFPEFDKRVINALREPLEEQKINISRAVGSKTFPADFLLVVAMNPCPCGYYGTNKCNCSITQINRYQSKISGPIADRIDLWIKVDKIEYEKLLDKKVSPEKRHEQERIKILKAREMQSKRYGNNIQNSRLSVKNIDKYIILGRKEKTLLLHSAERLSLSARAIHKVLKLARSIADLEVEEKIKEEHILEALSYREFLNP